MLQRKDLFPKTVADACHILSRWQNAYSNNNTRLTEANDSIAFATTGTEDTKGSKKKDITYYKCKKTGHYANECGEDDENVKTSNKKVSNFLVLNKDQDSSDEKADMTISHEHLVAVHEDEKEEEYEPDGDTAEEEGTSNDDEDTECDEDYEGFVFLQDDVLCSIEDKLAISKAGYNWTASPQWMCSATLNFLVTFEM